MPFRMPEEVPDGSETSTSTSQSLAATPEPPAAMPAAADTPDAPAAASASATEQPELSDHEIAERTQAVLREQSEAKPLISAPEPLAATLLPEYQGNEPFPAKIRYLASCVLSTRVLGCTLAQTMQPGLQHATEDAPRR
jgi:hypothetical protein